jgi:phytoene dehydrogenase-like protein
MYDVVIVGAGLAGLACARILHARGASLLVLEASDAVGGRARTDVVQGFVLDRGFQVLLTAYPEAQKMLDYDVLRLGKFRSGALIRTAGRFHHVADPWRSPGHALSTLVAPVGTLRDKWKIARLRRHVTESSLSQLFEEAETSTNGYLEEFGFSPSILERFFYPFYRGIFLEDQLLTSSRMFEFVFRMFSEGEAALPFRGMGAMAQYIVSQLPPRNIRLNTRVTAISSTGVTTATGEHIPANATVVATDFISTAALMPDFHAPASRSTACLYYATETPPVAEPILVLNGEGQGPINNLCVPSLVAPSYAPPGQHLVSVSVVGAASSDRTLEPRVRQQLSEWFGDQMSRWRHLRTYWIPNALPAQTTVNRANGKARISNGIYMCGDHMETASIKGALRSGRHAAEAVIADNP